VREDFGSSLFKVQGEEATVADTMAVLRAIVESSDARAKCGGLSGFIRDMQQKERQERAENMASIYFSAHEPPSPEKLYTVGHQTTPWFVDRCCPPPFSKWKKHIRANYDKRGKATSASVHHQEVMDILRAIEHLWGVHGHLLRA
jgi:hypothetical protein